MFSQRSSRSPCLNRSAWLAGLCFLAACAKVPVFVPPEPIPAPPLPTPIVAAWQPTQIQIQDLDPDFRQASTFVVVPAARIGTRAAPISIMDQRLLYLLRNAFESRGYLWTSGTGSPQLVVALDWRFPAPGEPASPALRAAWPDRVTALPGDLFAVAVDPSWGTWDSTTRQPEGASRVAWCAPEVQVSVFSSAAGELVWQAQGHGRTEEGRASVALPRVLDETLAGLPRAARPAHGLRRGEGRLGVRLHMATTDGQAFLPRVEALAEGFPAEQALDVGDWVLNIEGRSVRDLPLTDLQELLRGPPGSTLRMRVSGPEGEARTVYIERVAY